MLNCTKIILIYENLPLSVKRDVAILAANFLNRRLFIMHVAANPTHLALILQSNSNIRCLVADLRDACCYEGVRPVVYAGKVSMFLRLTSEWPEKWPSQNTKLGDSCAQLMSGNCGIVNFLKKHPSQLRYIAQYQSSLFLYKKLTNEFKTFSKKRGHIIIAPSNSGKTTAAVNLLLKGFPYYIKDPTDVNFDGYFGQSGMLIDDIDINSPLLSILKHVINITPGRVKLQNGTLLVNFQIIVLTSKYSLLQLTNDKELREALKSRLNFWTLGDSYSLIPL